MEVKRKAQRKGLYLFIVGAVLFVLFGVLWHPIPALHSIDLRVIYYASQDFLRHQDPYFAGNPLHTYSASAEYSPPLPPWEVHVISFCVYLPTALMLIAPIALLPWGVANILWIALIAVSFVFAAYLMWRVASDWSPGTAAVLVFIFLTGSQVLLEIENAAGIAVSFCTIAAAAIVHERFARIGVVLLAIGLLMKPQDAGLVWLYFLLAGGTYRRRALQTLAIVAVVFFAAAGGAYRISPHWLDEWRANLAFLSLPGYVNNPGPLTTDPAYRGSMIVSLQTVSSLFFTSSRTYNLIAYLICGPLLAIWAWTAIRACRTVENAYFALAAIAPLSMLPLYHRQYDTKLMILAIPACVFLWAKRGTAGRLALAITTLAALVSSSLIGQVLGILSFDIRHSAVGWHKVILTAALARPIPISMLLMSLFFCWYWARLVFLDGAHRTASHAQLVEDDGQLVFELEKQGITG